DDEIGMLAPCAVQTCLAVIGDVDGVPLDLEPRAQSVREIGVVLDDQNVSGLHQHQLSLVREACSPVFVTSGVAGDAVLGCRGNSTTTRAPPPAIADSTQARPPCSVTSSRTTERPMPLPPVPDSARRLRRTYGSHTRYRSAAGMPGPWSSTQKRTRCSWTTCGAVIAPTVIVCPAGPYFTALSSRLSKI